MIINDGLGKKWTLGIWTQLS